MKQVLPLLEREEEIGGGDGSRWLVEARGEAKRLGHLAAPLMAVTISGYLLQVISTMMVGHLGKLELAGSSIASSLSSVTGFSFLIGLSCGLETLCGQAYGAEQYRKVGVDMQRAIVTLAAASVPIAVLWSNTPALLVLAGQDPEIAAEAGRYIAFLIPSLFAYSLTQPLVKFLQSQGLVAPMVWSFLLALCVHVPLCWALVFQAGMGNAGAALAFSVSNWANALALGLYVGLSAACERTRAPVSPEALRGIGNFLRLAVPSALMICFEWWSFELVILASGLLPNPELETSVLSICISVTSMLYCIPYAIGSAASTRVSNELGAGNQRGARVATRTALAVAGAQAAAVSLAVFLLRGVFGYAYSRDPGVVAYVAKVAPLMSLAVVLDGFGGVLSGVARGCGWQHLGTYINLGSFYLLGIPLAVVLGFAVQLRGFGLYVGILSGGTVQVGLLAVVTYFTNWQNQAKIARERAVMGKLEEDTLK